MQKKMDKNEIDWNKVITSNRDVYKDSGKLFHFFRVPLWLTVCLRTRLSKDGNPAFVQFELFMVQLCFRKFKPNEMIFVIIDNVWNFLKFLTKKIKNYCLLLTCKMARQTATVQKMTWSLEPNIENRQSTIDNR